MNPSDSPAPTPRDYSESQMIIELQRSLHSLRTMLHLIALCGIVLSAALSAILYRQIKVQRQQMREAIAYINDYNTNWVPRAEIIRSNLVTFARTHPNIIPILQKYTNTNAPPPDAAKAPDAQAPLVDFDFPPFPELLGIPAKRFHPLANRP